MALTDSDRQTLRDLELRLLDPSVRAQPTLVATLFAEDFVDVGASGRHYTRPDILASLSAEPPCLEASASDFEIREIASDVALVSYLAESRANSDAPRTALRTSIWRRTGSGWQIFHHQGTPTEQS